LFPISDFTCDFEAEDNCGFTISATSNHLRFAKHHGEQEASANLPSSDHTGSPTAKFLSADFRLNEDGSGTDNVVTTVMYRGGFHGSDDRFLCMHFWYSINVSLTLRSCGPKTRCILLLLTS
jgi:hypothetical protein